ncbi:MAG: hypothetical protein HY240_08860 [Actinobacteria bacterium]|nr:hypothetical protein [Actinomycetota bacterium]
MSADPAFAPRVRRLAIVSAIALGVIWMLAVTTPGAPAPVSVSLLLAWVSMPTVLAASLRRPRVRSIVALPSALAAVALIAICVTALPADDPLAAAGWLSITAGILLGAWLGAWFWYRWFPVPVSLDAPFSTGRWALIAVHVGLVVAGVLLVLAARVV